MNIKFEKITSSAINPNLETNNFYKLVLQVNDSDSYLKVYDQNHFLVEMQSLNLSINASKDFLINHYKLNAFSQSAWDCFKKQSNFKQVSMIKFTSNIFDSKQYCFEQCQEMIQDAFYKQVNELYEGFISNYCEENNYHWNQNLLIEFDQVCKLFNNCAHFNSNWKLVGRNFEHFLDKNLNHVYDVWKNYLHEKNRIAIVNYYLSQNKQKTILTSKQFKQSVSLKQLN